MNTTNGFDRNGHNDLLYRVLPIDKLVQAGRQLENLEAVENYALSLARGIRTAAYDPTQNPDDRMREDQFQKDLEESKELEKAASHAALGVRDAERHQATIQSSLVQPIPDWRITIPATAALAISIAPTLHDAFFHFDDELLSWMVSFTAGGLIGSLITWSLIGVKDASGKRTAVNVAGLLGALGIGVCTFLLRLSSGDLLSAIALTVLEFAAVALLEAHASSLRREHQQFSAACEEHVKAAAKVQAEKTEAGRRTGELQERQNRIQQHQEFLTICSFCSQKAAEIEQAALDIARRAFYERQAEERRTRLGLPKE